MKTKLIAGSLAIVFMALVCPHVQAQEKSQPDAEANAGLADLDKAAELKLSVRRLNDIQRVVELCDSALEKGLDEENAAFARELASASLYQRANQMGQAIFSQNPPDPRWRLFRQVAMNDLKKALTYKPDQPDVNLLVAKLETLPGGDAEAARKAVDKAVDGYTDDRKSQAEALVLRAGLTDDLKRQQADLDRAVELAPENTDARKARGLFYLQLGESEKAEQDFAALLNDDADNIALHHALAEALIAQKKYDQAMTQIERAEKVDQDNPANYLLRAKLHALQEKVDEAMKDLDKALELEPRSATALLMRARLHQAQGDTKEAIADVSRIISLNPDHEEALHLRALLYAASNSAALAIEDLEHLIEMRPDRTDLQLALATLYTSDNRPRKAVEVFDDILRREPDNMQALRGRGDARLSIGDHKQAIADLEAALKVDPDNSGVLNNLSWVLSTTPKENLRDGERAIELAKKACEITDYKEAHILSTLAAAYAETGDFESAKKWSSKAVEMGEGQMKKQLEEELNSYKEKKPWRELQQTEEKIVPRRDPRDTFEL